MTVDPTGALGPFDALASHEFAVLTTYRRNGDAVPTTIWFANDGDRLYITTQTGAGKIRRVREDGRVTLAPSDRVGGLLGQPEIAGRAHEADPSERPRAATILAKKYGAQWRQIVGSVDDSPERAYIVVERP